MSRPQSQNASKTLNEISPVVDLDLSRESDADVISQLRRRHGQSYQPHAEISIEKGNYTIRTLQSWHELEAMARLRHRIFYVEQCGIELESGLDLDRLDIQCDHIGIFKNSTGELLGSYRLTSTLFSNRFYSSERFQLRGLMNLDGNKLELGRACVDPLFRGSLALHLLWRGIMQYALQTETAYLFGCASLRHLDLYQLARLCAEIANSRSALQYCDLPVVHERRLDSLAAMIAAFKTMTRASNYDLAEKHLPPLFQFYLGAGAQVAPEPAVDTKLNCYDFMTVLALNEINQRHAKKYRASHL